MGGYNFNPRGTSPAGMTSSQGGPAAKPSLWDTWTQRAYSLRPLGNRLQQAGNNLEQRSLNMLHGDSFRTDAQVYPPLPPSPAPRPPTDPPVRGGIPALGVQRGGVSGPQSNISRLSVPGQRMTGGPATVGGHTLSPQALQWIAQCEGGYSHNGNVYDNDGNGTKNCTVGYGHLLHAGPCNGSPDEYHRSQPQAEADLRNDARVHEDWVNQHIREPLTQSQFDALTSLHFNLQNFEGHDVWKNDLQNPAHSNMNNVPSDIRTLGGGGGGLPYRRDGEANMWNGIYPDLSDPNVCNAYRKVPLVRR
jgi:lysozyme